MVWTRDRVNVPGPVFTSEPGPLNSFANSIVVPLLMLNVLTPFNITGPSSSLAVPCCANSDAPSFINSTLLTAFDISKNATEAPFAGRKDSGVGHEGGREGLYDNLETKLISLGGLG